MPKLINESTVNYKETFLNVKNDSLLLHPNSPATLNIDPEDYIFTVKHYYKALNKNNIIFNDYLESPRKSYIDFLNTSARIILEELNINPNSCKYWSGAAPISSNKNLYCKLINEHNLLDIPIEYSNYFEYNFSNTLNCEEPPVFLYEKVKKPFKFLFLAGSERLHRVWLLTNFIRHDILKNCLYSFFSNKKIILDKMDSIPADLFTNKDKRLIRETNYTLPYFLNLKADEWSLQHQLRKSDIENFNNTYLSIVAETIFFQNEYGKNNIYIDNLDYHYNFHFLTEKTYRAIALKHPFILASLPYSLQALRELGYRTFSPYIDESYDAITNDKERLEKILTIVKQLNDFTDSQWVEFYRNTKEITEFNYNLIKSRRFQIVQ